MIQKIYELHLDIFLTCSGDLMQIHCITTCDLQQHQYLLAEDFGIHPKMHHLCYFYLYLTFNLEV